jgi:hypothetical protein
MEQEHGQKMIDVRVVYPSAHHPAEKNFPPETTIGLIKQFALEFFGLKEEPIEGNQVVFFLFHGRNKIENLEQPLSSFVEGNSHHSEFRLAKEIVAGV